MYTPLLSIDGGGLLGIFPLFILRHLEQAVGKPSSALFRLISGASTGGIIALGLCVPNEKGEPLYSAHDILTFYKTYSKRVFQRSTIGHFCSFLRPLEILHHLFSCKYSAEGMESCFTELFKGCTISQALTNVLVPAYNLAETGAKESRLKMFTSYKSGALSFKGDYAMADIARATSAAPSYFPPKIIERRDLQGNVRSFPPYCLIDGALAAHDPSLLAYVEAQSLFKKNAQFLLVSLGTNSYWNSYRKILLRPSPGLFAWQSVLARLLLDPGRSSHQLILRRLTQNHETMQYKRFVPEHEKPRFSFDDISPQHIAYLEKRAHYTLKNRYVHSLNKLVSLLKERS